MNLFKTLNDLDFIEKENEISTVVEASSYIHIDENTPQRRSFWDDEEGELVLSEKEPNMQEISLYDPCKSVDENFEKDSSPKHLLVRVESKGTCIIDTKIPDQFSKVIYDLNRIEEYGSTPEMLIVDFDSIFGLRLTSFIQYNSDFFTCDERVFFEALLIKFKNLNNFKPFYWSKEVIWQELGIKKDRASRIIKRFRELGIISTEVRKSVVNNRPQQVTYFNLHADKIMALLPQIFVDREDSLIKRELKKYLNIREE